MFGISISFKPWGFHEPNNDHPVYSPFYYFNINGIYKFRLSELITHSHYWDMAEHEIQKPNFIGLEANLKNRERRKDAL